MHAFTLPKHVSKTSIGLHQWTETLLDTSAPNDRGRVRLEWRTGRRAGTAVLEEFVRQYLPEVSDESGAILTPESRAYLVDGGSWSAEQLSIRLYYVARQVFDTYENKSARTTKGGRRTKRPRNMSFALVLVSQDGRELARSTTTLRRSDDEDEAPPPVPGEEDFEAVPADDRLRQLTSTLIDERAALFTYCMRAMDSQGRTVEMMEKVTTQGCAQYESMGAAMAELYAKMGELQRDALGSQLEAERALLDSRADDVGFFESATGEMVAGQVAGVLERLLSRSESDWQGFLAGLVERVNPERLDVLLRLFTGSGRGS